ncbi:MAG: EscU/YscU/HrcU family type III secretion system export apparatus switch protein [Planctomycetota bacterium]
MNRQLAVALGYQPESDAAPRVLAAGRGAVAQRIQIEAQRHGVPLRTEPELAEFLAQVPVSDEIPEELYPAVAEILAFLLHLDREALGRGPPEGRDRRDPVR